MRKFQLNYFYFLFLLLMMACSSQKNITTNKNATKSAKNTTEMTYLALGDSYTIGERVEEQDRWPVQLTKKLNQAGFSFLQPKIIAKTGWRSDELLNAMNNQLEDEKYDLVSILIGVNNQYQGKNIDTFKSELKTTVEEAIAHSNTGKSHVFMVSIPDYGVTPFGKDSGKENISKEITMYNGICKQTAEDYGIPFYNITDISLKAATNSAMVAEDGLHPSGEMYRQWVEKIAPKIEKKLSE